MRKLGLLKSLEAVFGMETNERPKSRTIHEPKGLTGKQWNKRKSRQKMTKASRKRNR